MRSAGLMASHDAVVGTAALIDGVSKQHDTTVITAAVRKSMLAVPCQEGNVTVLLGQYCYHRRITSETHDLTVLWMTVLATVLTYPRTAIGT